MLHSEVSDGAAEKSGVVELNRAKASCCFCMACRQAWIENQGSELPILSGNTHYLLHSR